MNHRSVAKKLTHVAVAYLLRHMDRGTPRAVPIIRALTRDNRIGGRGGYLTLDGLIRQKLLRYDKPTTPRETTLSEDGRMVLAYILGTYADALIGATGASVVSPEPTGEWRRALEKVRDEVSRLEDPPGEVAEAKDLRKAG